MLGKAGRMESKIVYFEEVGPTNTDATFAIVKERLAGSGIKKLVLASTTGDTAIKAMDYFKDSGVQLVVVPHQYDFVGRDENRFPKQLVKTLRDAGHEVHFGTMLFHTDKLYGNSAPTLIANILRCFSQGTKVCFEIVLMATDAGYLAKGEKVIAICGTGRGSDTALVMQASSTHNLKYLKVFEILCKPFSTLTMEEIRERREREAAAQAQSTKQA